MRLPVGVRQSGMNELINFCRGNLMCLDVEASTDAPATPNADFARTLKKKIHFSYVVCSLHI